MPDRNRSADRNTPSNDQTNKARNRLESETDPDPESSQSMDPFVMYTQKGQAKEDGDPSEDQDQPFDNQAPRS